MFVLREVAVRAHLQAVGAGRDRALRNPLDEVVEADVEQLEVRQAVHPRAEGDVVVRERRLPQRHVVVGRVAGTHVGDGGELVEPEPVAGLVAVVAALAAALVAGAEGVVREGHVAVAQDLYGRDADVVKASKGKPDGKKPS